MGKQYEKVCTRCNKTFDADSKTVTICKVCQQQILHHLTNETNKPGYDPYASQKRTQFNVQAPKDKICLSCKQPFSTTHPSLTVCLACQVKLTEKQTKEKEDALHALTVSQHSEGSFADEIKTTSLLVRKHIKTSFPQVKLKK